MASYVNKQIASGNDFVPLVWKETSSFSKHKHVQSRKSVSGSFKAFSFFFSLLFCCGLWVISGFKANFLVILAASIILPLIVIPILIRASGAPKKISIKDRVLVVDRERINYDELMSVRLGHIFYAEVQYPVASFVLKAGNEKVVGLPDDSYFKKLQISLNAKGVLVEDH